MLTIIKTIIRILFRVEMRGEYLGGKTNGHERTLIIANHSSYLDAILLLLFLPEKPIFVIHRESARSRFNQFFLHYADYITVESLKPMPMRKVLRNINQGRPVVIFPEGRVTEGGSLLKMYSGAAFAALKTGATIIPVQIRGSHYSSIKRLGRMFTPRLPQKFVITLFPPTQLDVENIAASEEQVRLGREEMHHLMMETSVEARNRMTLFEMLVESRDKYGKDKLAYRDGMTDDLSYGALVTKSVSLSILLRRKITLSKRVGVMLPNANGCVLAFYAMQHCGHTSVMINYTSGLRAITAGLIASEVKTIITSRRFIKKGELEPLIEGLTDYDIIYLEDLRDQLTIFDKLAIALQRSFPIFTAAKQQPEKEVLVLFTSGTEGLPKGVVHSHDSLGAQLAQVQAIYDFHKNDMFMLCLPAFHVFGLMGGFVLPIVSGASSVLYPSPLHYKAIPEQIYENGCTVLLSTSTFLAGYARFAQSYDFHSLRYVVAGAEKLSLEVSKVYAEKFGVRIMEGYGATEAAPVISAETTMCHKRGSVGRLIPCLRGELVPVDGIDEGGRLVIYGDNIMLGYLRADNPGVIEYSEVDEHNKRAYDTGDIVKIDEKGIVELCGRVKRFAKIAGEMVSLDTVEKIAQHSSSDFQHAAIILTDSKTGEAICLCTTDENLIRKQLQHSSKELGIPKLAVPKDIRFVTEIPLFASGKVNYPALAELIDKK